MGWIIIPVFFVDMSSSSSRASTVMAVARSPRLLHPPNRHFPHSNSDPFTFKTSSKDSILRTQISTSPSTAAVRGSARWACCCLAGSEPLSSSSSSRRLPKWVGGVWRQCAKFAVPCALAVGLSLSGMNVGVCCLYIYIYICDWWMNSSVCGCLAWVVVSEFSLLLVYICWGMFDPHPFLPSVCLYCHGWASTFNKNWCYNVAVVCESLVYY